MTQFDCNQLHIFLPSAIVIFCRFCDCNRNPLPIGLYACCGSVPTLSTTVLRISLRTSLIRTTSPDGAELSVLTLSSGAVALETKSGRLAMKQSDYNRWVRWAIADCVMPCSSPSSVLARALSFSDNRL